MDLEQENCKIDTELHCVQNEELNSNIWIRISIILLTANRKRKALRQQYRQCMTCLLKFVTLKNMLVCIEQVPPTKVERRKICEHNILQENLRSRTAPTFTMLKLANCANFKIRIGLKKFVESWKFYKFS